MSNYNTIYKQILSESRIATITTGFYQCINAENLGHILNVLNCCYGTRTIDGGVIELFYSPIGENLQAVKLIASLFEHGFLRKYPYGDTKHFKTYKTLIFTKDQLLNKIPGLQLKDYTQRKQQIT